MKFVVLGLFENDLVYILAQRCRDYIMFIAH